MARSVGRAGRVIVNEAVSEWWQGTYEKRMARRAQRRASPEFKARIEAIITRKRHREINRESRPTSDASLFDRAHGRVCAPIGPSRFHHADVRVRQDEWGHSYLEIQPSKIALDALRKSIATSSN